MDTALRPERLHNTGQRDARTVARNSGQCSESSLHGLPAV